MTNLVRDGGVAENWLWWSFLLTGMATVFFYARLWRRSGVLTDLEFYELRYAGRAASFVRGFRAIYLGLFFNCWIIATVNLALVKIAGVLFGWPRWETLAICVVIPIIFAATAGSLGRDGHRHDSVLHHDELGVRGGVLCDPRAGCRRLARAHRAF